MVRALTPDGLAALLQVLHADGYRTYGPTRGAHAVEVGPLRDIGDLPRGIGDDTAPGRYRMTGCDDGSYFGFAAPANSYKALLFPPRQVLFSATRTEHGLRFEPQTAEPQPMAFIGIRGCDLAAIAILDRIFIGGEHPDQHYAARRAGLFLVAVDCARPAPTCFCTSMGSGPAAGAGADVVLTEVRPGERFLAQDTSDAGRGVLARLPTEPATPRDFEAAEQIHRTAVSRIQRSVHLDAEPDPEHRAWQQIGDRCLACGNCTLACPTCFCFDLDDDTDPVTGTASRTRTWSTCFERTHSRLHGGAVHASTMSRYRQWLDHKLATWQEQFGTIGCVGCGRCITWCPVGIDITAAAAALQETP